MTVNPERRKLIAVVAVAAATVVIVAAGAAAVGWLVDRDDETVVTQEPDDAEPESDDATDEGSADDDASTDDEAADDEAADDEAAEDDVNEGMTPTGGDVLPEPMSGQEAIDALGDDIEAVAALNNRDVDELRELLLRDQTLHISPSGFLFYIDTATPNLPDDDS